jgi:hypothetical protein
MTYSTLPMHEHGTPEITPALAAARLGRRGTPERSGVEVIELAATPGRTVAVHPFPHEVVAKPVADVVKPAAGAGVGVPPPPPPPPMPVKTDAGVAPPPPPPLPAVKISPPSRVIKDGVYLRVARFFCLCRRIAHFFSFFFDVFYLFFFEYFTILIISFQFSRVVVACTF